MKVLIFCWNIYPENTGGAGKSIYYTAKGLAKLPKVSAVHVLTSTKGHTRTEKNGKLSIERYNDLNIRFRTGENPFGLEDIKLKLGHLRIYKKWEERIRKKCKQFNPDIIHCNDPFVLRHVRKALKNTEIPLIISVRGPWPSSSGFMLDKKGKLVKRWGFKEALKYHSFRTPDKLYGLYKNRRNLKCVGGVHFVSEYTRKETEKHVKLNSIKRVIMNPRPYPNNYKKNKSSNKNIAYVGELTYKKGLHKLLDALELLKKEGKNYKLLIAGEGIMGSKFKEMTKEKGLDENITFLGWVNNPNKIYQSATITVVPSLFPDPLPGVAFESMFNDSIPIVSNRGGILETVPSKELVVNVENPQELANKIEEIMENPDKQKEMRKKFKPWLKKFSTETVAKQFLSLYEEVIKYHKNQKKWDQNQKNK